MSSSRCLRNSSELGFILTSACFSQLFPLLPYLNWWFEARRSSLHSFSGAFFAPAPSLAIFKLMVSLTLMRSKLSSKLDWCTACCLRNSWSSSELRLHCIYLNWWYPWHWCAASYHRSSTAFFAPAPSLAIFKLMVSLTLMRSKLSSKLDWCTACCLRNSWSSSELRLHCIYLNWWYPWHWCAASYHRSSTEPHSLRCFRSILAYSY